MINYYEELGLDPNLTCIQIREILEDKHSKALRILNAAVGDAEREYKIRKDLELIEEALRVFKDEEFRARYDEKLRAFKGSSKSGYLMSEKPDEGGGEPNIDYKEDTGGREEDDLEEYKRIQEMLKKKIMEETLSQIKKETSTPNPSTNKAKNLVLRAKQCLEAGNFKEAGAYINRALDENPTLFEAWELMFFYKLRLLEKGIQQNISNTIYKLFTAFYDRKEAISIGNGDINYGLTMLDKISSLRGFTIHSRDRASKTKHAELELRVIRKWLEERGPRRMVDAICAYYKTIASRADNQFFFDRASLNEDVRVAFKKAMEYGNGQQKVNFYNRAVNRLKDLYNRDLNIYYNYYKKRAGAVTQNLLAEIQDYERIVEDIKGEYSGRRKTINNVHKVIGFALNFISLLVLSLFLYAKFESTYGEKIYRLFFMLPIFPKDLGDIIFLYFKEHFIIAYFITHIIILITYAYIYFRKSSTKNIASVYIQWGIFAMTLAASIIYSLYRWELDGIFVTLFRLIIAGCGLPFAYIFFPRDLEPLTYRLISNKVRRHQFFNL